MSFKSTTPVLQCLCQRGYKISKKQKLVLDCAFARKFYLCKTFTIYNVFYSNSVQISELFRTRNVILSV